MLSVVRLVTDTMFSSSQSTDANPNVKCVIFMCMDDKTLRLLDYLV